MNSPPPAAYGVYQLAILGDIDAVERQILADTLREMIADFELELGTDVNLLDAATVGDRDPRVAFAAAYFAAGGNADIGAVGSLISASMPIIPTIAASGSFAQVPAMLQAANGLKRRLDDPKMVELASALLECVGLLHRQRRVFVSYRRTEARAAAVQLHDLLSARGFDVFLDTHRIRPGDPFQDVLWHRLVDSDVLVMLDTPTYFESRWTREEIGRARAKDIQVLRVVWPAHTPSRMTDLSETLHLDSADLKDPDGPIVENKVYAIALQVERLRSRSISARYMAITGKLRADVEKIGGTIEAIGAHRAISVRLFDGRRFWAYPVVGVPTAETLNDIAVKARMADQLETPVLVYDHIGIHAAWGNHLSWLDNEIKSVRALKVAEAGWRLAGWEPEA
ncbi:toll/interleukin-1 receptor domain-containing protein [Starkeya koreensis]|uniref:Toll/interleukin-1 receptor domain-containing protein n=1 Tax=Ancylobacter koreensis TaxID=266121 RepID=A0ABT0DK35_9HYPH|nr:toll/interleukin-1 receptor domain-containing protein [Ancylobacter koreensis]MCK0207437.1 toll/interleukin-1 receptor domain-containing protein [Ancylobacter koreensis]